MMVDTDILMQILVAGGAGTGALAMIGRYAFKLLSSDKLDVAVNSMAANMTQELYDRTKALEEKNAALMERLETQSLELGNLRAKCEYLQASLDELKKENKVREM